MFNFFEQPWTLLAMAIFSLFIVMTFRSVFPEKRHIWQWLIPICIAVTAFGLDKLVTTDIEQIKSTISTIMKAVPQANYGLIEDYIADNYSDSYHQNKASLLNHCRRELPRFMITKNKQRRSPLIELSDSKAAVYVFLLTTFDPESFVSEYKSFVMIKAQLFLEKQHDDKWLLSRIELVEVDRNPMTWKSIP